MIEEVISPPPFSWFAVLIRLKFWSVILRRTHCAENKQGKQIELYLQLFLLSFILVRTNCQSSSKGLARI